MAYKLRKVIFDYLVSITFWHLVFTVTFTRLILPWNSVIRMTKGLKQLVQTCANNGCLAIKSLQQCALSHHLANCALCSPCSFCIISSFYPRLTHHRIDFHHHSFSFFRSFFSHHYLKIIMSSRSARAGLQFPVSRIHNQLRKGNYANRIFGGAPVYLAGVIEYLVAEVVSRIGV